MTTTVAPLAALEALDGVTVAAGDAIECQGWLGLARQVRGFLDSFEAQVLRRVDALAQTGESHGAEDTSMRCSGVSSRDASKLNERARTLEAADGFNEALAAGDVTADHIDRLAAAAGSLPDDVRKSLFERSDELLTHATAHDPARFGRHVRDLARNLAEQAGISRDQQQRSQTRLSWKIAADGMYDIHTRLHPLLGNRLVRALDAEVAARIAAGEAAGDPEFVNRTVDRGRLAAEALADMVTGHHQMTRPIVADISVLIDIDTATDGIHDDTICETSDGAPLDINSVRALLCNGLITPVIRGTNGDVLNVGRTSRTPNRAQRRALRAMYRTCAAGGCETPFDRCEVHHIIPWSQGGPTDLDKLLPLCSHHHHLVHTNGWTLHLAPDRTLTITDPNGEIVTTATPDMPHRRTGPAPAGHPDQLAS